MPKPINEGDIQKPLDPPVGGSGVSSEEIAHNFYEPQPYIPKGFRTKPLPNPIQALVNQTNEIVEETVMADGTRESEINKVISEFRAGEVSRQGLDVNISILMGEIMTPEERTKLAEDIASGDVTELHVGEGAVRKVTGRGFWLKAHDHKDVDKLDRALMDHYCGFVTREYVQGIAFPMMPEGLSYDQKNEILSTIILSRTPKPAVPAKSKAEEELNEKEREVNRLVAEFMAGIITRKAMHDEAWVVMCGIGGMEVHDVEKLVNNKVRDAHLKAVTDVAVAPTYEYNDLDVIGLIEQLNFNRGSAIDCIARASLKARDGSIKDLEKAKWFVSREMARLADGGSDYDGTADAEALVDRMNYNRGSAVALISHAGTSVHRPATEDLDKAVYHLNREIARLKKGGV